MQFSSVGQNKVADMLLVQMTIRDAGFNRDGGKNIQTEALIISWIRRTSQTLYYSIQFIAIMTSLSLQPVYAGITALYNVVKM